MTDKKVLFKLCLAHAHNEEFFIRKAIGWALRDYAWIHPQAVQTFVDANRSKLSALSAREALKNIGV
jgi:3-methyladenine DNA glycosylase AlkD